MKSDKERIKDELWEINKHSIRLLKTLEFKNQEKQKTKQLLILSLIQRRIITLEAIIKEII